MVPNFRYSINKILLFYPILSQLNLAHLRKQFFSITNFKIIFAPTPMFAKWYIPLHCVNFSHLS
jgi:hypothetical protein